MLIQSGRRAISTALWPCIRNTHLPHPQRTFARGATVVPGIFPIHKHPLSFLRHQSISPKRAEIEDARPQIKPRYKIIYTCGVYEFCVVALIEGVKNDRRRHLVNSHITMEQLLFDVRDAEIYI